MKKGIIIGIAICIVIILVTPLMLYINTQNKKEYYTNEDFGIEKYVSKIDKDQDGIDDQTDFLQNVRSYVATKPKYQSKYYGLIGYPDDGYGVCTDVIAFGALDSGYDLRVLVYEDILSRKEEYGIDTPDINIDFRRVKNLKIYLDKYAISLTTDLSDISQWQGGDIVIFNKHIGVISDKRNEKGIPFLIHHAHLYQREYEENVLELMEQDIIGHYRLT